MSGISPLSCRGQKTVKKKNVDLLMYCIRQEEILWKCSHVFVNNVF